jgi:menaquinone-dependent protoporphyrinogen oxidase
MSEEDVMRVLIAYASANGSTRGIAEHVARRLASESWTVDCRSVTDVAVVDGYDAVVVGSAIHGQAWLPEAGKFVRDNAAQLAHVPTWLFSVGMPGALARRLQRWAMQEGPKVMAPYVALTHPRDTRLFSGVVSREQFPLPSRIVFRLMGGHYGDHRDWPAIDRWAEDIHHALTRATSAREGVLS